MRLTKYEPSKNSMFPYKLRDEESSTELDATHKLGQLEDIEDKLGIDLVTFFKILNGKNLYRKDSSGRIYSIFTVKEQECFFDEDAFVAHDSYYNSMHHGKSCYLHLKDYGKTWALTKEELL